MEIIIKTSQGLENILAKEVEEILGRSCEIGKRAVFITGTLQDVYLLNYKLRTAIRILVKMTSFTVHSYEDVYRELNRMNWSEIFSLRESFSIDATVFSPYFKNSQYVMHKAKDAIADYFRDNYGKRPNVDRQNANIRINVHVTERKMNVSLDSSGESLHKRGYKRMHALAPVSEVLAAGMLQLSEWDKKTLLYDPMCGSGTLLTEAAMLKYDIPSQKHRDDFCFMHWKDFDKSAWMKIKRDNQKSLPSENIQILGSDVDGDTIHDLESDLRHNKLSEYIDVQEGDFFEINELETPHHIIMNPPYNKRLGLEDAKEFYQMIGDTLKQKCKGSTAWVFSGEKELIKFVGLRPSQKIILFNGPIEARFHKFELF